MKRTLTLIVICMSVLLLGSCSKVTGSKKPSSASELKDLLEDLNLEYEERDFKVEYTYKTNERYENKEGSEVEKMSIEGRAFISDQQITQSYYKSTYESTEKEPTMGGKDIYKDIEKEEVWITDYDSKDYDDNDIYVKRTIKETGPNSSEEVSEKVRGKDEVSYFSQPLGFASCFEYLKGILQKMKDSDLSNAPGLYGYDYCFISKNSVKIIKSTAKSQTIYEISYKDEQITDIKVTYETATSLAEQTFKFRDDLKEVKAPSKSDDYKKVESDN